MALAADQSKLLLKAFHLSSVALAGLVPAAAVLEARPLRCSLARQPPASGGRRVAAPAAAHGGADATSSQNVPLVDHGLAIFAPLHGHVALNGVRAPPWRVFLP